MTNSDLLAIILSVFGAGGLFGWVGQWFLARYSKNKHEREAGLAKEYLTLAQLSADELERRINLIGKLDDENRELQNEVFLLKQSQQKEQERREERDDHFIAMESQIAALQTQVDKDARERKKLAGALAELDLKNRVLWKYLIALIEQLKRHNIVPVAAPDELKSDPEIVALLGRRDKSEKP